MKVTIQRVNLPSLGKMGCLLGAVAAFLPSLFCGLLGVGLAGLVIQWLEGWQEMTISLLGQEIARFDLVEFFGLEQLLESLQGVAAASAWMYLLAAFLVALVAGAFLAVIIILVGLVYNALAAATGGLVVEMDAVTPKEGDSSSSERAPNS